MGFELAAFIFVLALLLLLAASLWRRSRVTQEEFFPSQRARVLGAVRLRAGGLLAVAIVAFSAQFVVSQQRLDELNQKEQRLLQYESELLRLRVQYQLARRHEAVAQVVAAAPAPVPETEVAQVSVARAVVRDRPAGQPQFTLGNGARVQLRGAPAHGSGRLWREALTDDGRRGWIAVEVLSNLGGASGSVRQ